MSKEYCCEILKHAAEYKCQEHVNPFDCPDQVVIRNDLGDFGLLVRNPKSPLVTLIYYCPWCGAKLGLSDKAKKIRNPY